MSQSILQLAPPPADERIVYGPGPHHFADLRLPAGAGPHPVAIVIHGGFWRAAYDLEHIGHLCDALRKAGVATWSLEYRRIGNPGGGWPGTFEDVARGADHLRAIAIPFHLHLNRVVAMGHSAGGHLALWLGARTRLPADHALRAAEPIALNGIVSLAGVADLKRAWELKLSNSVVADLLGGSPEDIPDRYAAASPIELLPFGIPQKLIHGTLDRNVPFEISERYVSAAKARGDSADLVALDGAGHFEVIDPRTAEFSQVQQAVEVSLLR
jgi:acetyl esterase/lipase